MSVLLLRLAGPMQSWGTQSRFTIRDGANEPSKSGVVGLLCAALGRPRSEPVDDLAALRMGVRVDVPGAARAEFQTAGGTHRTDERYGVIKADGSRGETVTSRRHYLADADFLVGLDGDQALLEGLRDALERPRWQLYLGRKSYLPAVPVLVGLRADSLGAVLRAEPWPGGHRTDRRRLRRLVAETDGHRLRVVLEQQDGSGEDVRADQPLGAAFATRAFGLRSVTTTFYTVGTEVPLLGEDADVPVQADPESA
jgi:CRISPR system Cascade subunit CasD